MASQFINNILSMFDPRFKKEADYLEKILAEYEKKHPIYEEFRAASHKALQALLEEGGYRYQISSRTKTKERLKEKLLRKKDQDIYYSFVSDIEDIVGLRVVFYTERDRERFLKALKQELSGAFKTEEVMKENGYKATHVVMSFGSKRTSLSEYRHFAGLKSELQITSILQHAWAEIEHDLIYKDVNNLKVRDPRKFEILKEKMNHILEKYIKKASQELEDVMEKE